VKDHADVVRAVFEHRGTTLPRTLSYDTEAIETMSRNWKRFIGSLEEEFQGRVPAEFAAVIEKIDLLLKTLLQGY
jgi:hypothetical protein